MDTTTNAAITRAAERYLEQYGDLLVMTMDFESDRPSR